MAETMGSDIGTQILHAIQGLGVRMEKLEVRMEKLEVRMDGLEARMEKLEARMDGLEMRMEKLEARMDGLDARMDGLEAQVKVLNARMDGLEAQVTDLLSRMTRQEKLMEILGAEFINWREGLHQLRTDTPEGFRRLNARLELTEGTVVLMASVLRRPTELGEDLEKRLRELQTH